MNACHSMQCIIVVHTCPLTNGRKLRSAAQSLTQRQCIAECILSAMYHRNAQPRTGTVWCFIPQPELCAHTPVQALLAYLHFSQSSSCGEHSALARRALCDTVVTCLTPPLEVVVITAPLTVSHDAGTYALILSLSFEGVSDDPGLKNCCKSVGQTCKYGS